MVRYFNFHAGSRKTHVVVVCTPSRWDGENTAGFTEGVGIQQFLHVADGGQCRFSERLCQQAPTHDYSSHAMKFRSCFVHSVHIVSQFRWESEDRRNLSVKQKTKHQRDNQYPRDFSRKKLCSKSQSGGGDDVKMPLRNIFSAPNSNWEKKKTIILL